MVYRKSIRNARPLALLLLAFGALLGGAPSARADVVNQIVLRVNDHIATLYDYQVRRQEAVKQLQARGLAREELQQQLARVGAVVFKEMFQDLLLDSRADQLGIEAPPEQVEAELAEIRQQSGISNDADYRAALQQWGLTDAQVREQLRRRIRTGRVMQEIYRKIQLEEEDLRRYYRANQEKFRQPDQLQLREVVVLEEGGLPAEERTRLAGEIRQAVLAGKTLAEATAEHTQKGAVSAVIDLGWVSPGDLDESLESAVWKLPAGAVSEPVPARGGLHLVQVVERRESRIPPFNEVADQIRRVEQNRLLGVEGVKYMQDLEKQALIVANPPAEAANFRDLLRDPNEAPSAAAPGAAPTAGPGGLASEAAPGAPGAEGATEGAAPGTLTPLPPTGTTDPQPGILQDPKPITNTTPPPPPGV